MYRKLALLLIALLLAAAFFLPEMISGWNDRLLLDSITTVTQDGDREGFAESIQLTVAEKLLLLRTGALMSMDLRTEMVSSASPPGPDGTSVESAFFITDGEDGEFLLHSAAGQAGAPDGELDAYSESLRQLWEGRLASVRKEVRTLQDLGGLPALWGSQETLSYSGYGEILYMDPDTGMSFQVYSMALAGDVYTMDVRVDVQSGRLLSFNLQWEVGAPVYWGLRDAAVFGPAWRNYWGMDAVENDWYNNYNRSMLEQVEAQIAINGDYTSHGQVSFTYDSQSIPIPLDCYAYAGRFCSIGWNDFSWSS